MTEKIHFEQEIKDDNRQRVMVFQGGAALGAYEAGCYKELYNWLRRDVKDDENIFDIIAGTSVGAINASILVSYVKERREKERLGIAQSWEGSDELLERFWLDTSTQLLTVKSPAFAPMWFFYFSKEISESKEQWVKILRNWYAQTKSIPYLNRWYEFLLYFAEEYFDAPASSEAARRYYSAKEFQRRGASNVFSPLPFGVPEYFWPFYYSAPPVAIPKLDFKFWDNSRNLLFRYTNHPLRKILENYVKFPIATSFSGHDDDVDDHENKQEIKKQPRLLIISIDVQEGSTVTFDSYPYIGKKCAICNKEFKVDNNRKTEKQLRKELIQHIYQDHGVPYHDERPYNKEEDSLNLRLSVFGDEKKKYCISYSKGIELKHVIATASVPIVYDYEKINALEFVFNGNTDSDTDTNNISNDIRAIKPGQVDLNEKENQKGQRTTHYFWDGQYLSNTPLRELFGAHTIFWKDKIGYETLRNNILRPESIDEEERERKSNKDESKLSVPDLEVYIANLWPKKEVIIPRDHDGLVDRKNDITFHDKSEYDEKVARFVTDYIDVIKQLVKVGSSNKAVEDKIEKILDKDAETVFRDGKHRKYWDLLVGRFDVKKVIRIERTDDPDAISEKWGDYSYESVHRLFEQGRKDLLRTLLEEEIIRALRDMKNVSDPDKHLLLEPLKEATNELSKSSNILDQTSRAYDWITNVFIKELERRKGIDNRLKEAAYYIAKRLDPSSWQEKSLLL